MCMEYTDARSTFICDHADLFWFVPEAQLTGISDACLVETVLNYGSMDAVRRLIAILGINEVARVFAESTAQSRRRRRNYHDLTYHFFRQVFRRYAPQYSN